MVLPDDALDSLLGNAIDPVAAGLVLRQVGAAEPKQWRRLVAELVERSNELPDSDPAIIGALLRGIHILALKDEPTATRDLDPASIGSLIASLPDRCANRHLLLHLLTLARTDAALQLAVVELIAHPPAAWVEVGQVLSPLMQFSDWSVSAVFPSLLEAIEHQSIASPLLDLANFLLRTGRVDIHPAAHRIDTLNRLLSAVTGRLEGFERDPTTFGDEIVTVQERLAHAVSLSVSLCDAMGLIGDAKSLPPLEFAMQLKHRRVQSEAAGALARLGDVKGREHLVSLASEPSARLRVIAYAEELGFEDDIEPQFRTDAAIAEAELAVWLSQPDRFGLPPTSLETIDQRHWMWPGFDDPVACFLIRFNYDLGSRRYSNIGIAGPAVYALACDVADMQNDDIYAIYAGWHAEHNDIFAISAAQFNAGQKRVAEQYRDHLDRAGYEQLQPELFGVFFEEHAVVFLAEREGKSCRVLTDGLETIPVPLVGRSRPLQAPDLWNLYKGRKILRTFNPQVE